MAKRTIRGQCKNFRLYHQVFKLDWVILSIVILCVIAMLLYGALNLVEKKCLRGRE